MQATLSLEQIDALKRLDTCTVANAIETFAIRLRNEGYAEPSLRSIFPEMPPMVGYAVTVRIRCSNPPPTVNRGYVERTDWWNHVLTMPAPRVVVIEDVDEKCGAGAFVGEVHAHILQALGCVGVLTNGTVRDVPAIQAIGMPLFATAPAVSHAYVHVVEFGCDVEIAGLTIRPGDLLHGDCHGVLNVPAEIAGEIPAVAARLLAKEREVIDLCHSPNFSVDRLRAAVKGVFD